MFGMQMGFYSSTPNNHTHSMDANAMGASAMGGDGMNGDRLGNGMNGGMGEGMTPGGQSTGTEGEKDPFLSLLEQLAENEHSRGGPSELDFFLSGGNG